MRAMLMLGLMSLCGVCFGQDANPQVANQPAKKAERLDAFETMLGTGSTLAEWRTWWGTMLDAQVQSDARRYSLNAEEQRKLRAAGLKDVGLLFNRIEAAREEFEALEGRDAMVGKVTKVRVDLIRGPFDADSTYEKVLRRMKEPRALRFSLSPDRI